MYGTIARIHVAPGRERELLALQRELDELAVPGYRGAIVYRSDAEADAYDLVVLFADRRSYDDNARSAEQQERHARFRALLDRDPEWRDGEIVHFHVLLPDASSYVVC